MSAEAPVRHLLTTSRLTGDEVLRKLVHMGVGGIAFTIRFLGPFWSAVCALGGVLFNLAVLPRIGGRRLWRRHESERGASLGIVLYPIAVLILIVVFHRRLEIAAAIWGILAFGDGMASLVGMGLGRRALPWNRRKSWAGSVAYWLFGTGAAAILLLWTAPGRYPVAFAIGVAALTAFASAVVESLPIGLDDNITVPPVAGLLLFCLVLTEATWSEFLRSVTATEILVAAGVNAAFAVGAYLARGVDRSGLVAGFLVGFAVYLGLGWRGWILLLAFFVVGTGLTKLGYAVKAEAELAQEGGGRRSARHAVANGGTAALAALFAAATPYPTLFAAAAAGALATAAADTAGSEIGQLWGRRTFLVTSLRPVPRGTQGAISVEGTLAGVLAAALVAVVGFAVGLLPIVAAVAVAGAGILGSLVESLGGALLEDHGLVDNEAINFANTVVGALIAVGLVLLR